MEVKEKGGEGERRTPAEFKQQQEAARSKS